MEKRDHTRTLAALAEAWRQHAPASAALNERAKQRMIDGGNHALRLVDPFPPRVVSAQGGWIVDEDGHRILDFWQGHFANILGHNPKTVTGELVAAFQRGWGLQSGFTDRLQVETAELFCRQTGTERVRFTTSGALATMYAIMLSRSFTGRQMVLKIGGGWHGAQPWGLMGYQFKQGYDHPDSEGLPGATATEVLITRFNDTEMLEERFRQFGDRIACFIIEPVNGGSMIAGTVEYLQAARRFTEKHGVLLILDEVITGFRFRAGNVGQIYGVKPDVGTFGKVMGGGMPVAAVAGRADVLGLAGRAAGSRVKFSGGTYSAHPASMLAAKTMMTYLVEHEKEVYPRLAELGGKVRRTMETAFTEEGLYARCTGDGPALGGSSLFKIHFPYGQDAVLDTPDEANDPSLCDVTLSGAVLELALLLEGVHLLHGHGSAATVHTDEDLKMLDQVCRRAARRIKASA